MSRVQCWNRSKLQAGHPKYRMVKSASEAGGLHHAQFPKLLSLHPDRARRLQVLKRRFADIAYVFALDPKP